MTREEEIITMIEDVLSRKKAALRGHDIVLFGSRANGTAKERSDFDIGVVGEKPLDIKTFYDIEDEFDNSASVVLVKSTKSIL